MTYQTQQKAHIKLPNVEKNNWRVYPSHKKHIEKTAKLLGISQSQLVRDILDISVKQSISAFKEKFTDTPLQKEFDDKKYFKITDTPNKKTSDIIKECKDLFPVYVYRGESADTEFPPPKKETTRYFKKNVEADEEYANMSADDLEKKGIQGITLRERLLMEIKYFKETGKHLDNLNWTLCSGSCYSDGRVPCAGWCGGRLEVDWRSVGDRISSLRARVAERIY